jgi:hypothetical protein
MIVCLDTSWTLLTSNSHQIREFVGS